MTIAALLKKTMEFYKGNNHSIAHMLRVWGYAKTIGELEKLDPHTQFVLEAAAVTHDIGIPIAMEKYGSAKGEYQEKEGASFVLQFLSDTDFTEEDKARISFLLGHHHTPEMIDNIDYQILIEADYLVNADNGKLPPEKVEEFANTYFKTAAGKTLLGTVLLAR